MKAKKLVLVVLAVFVVALLSSSVYAAERKVGRLSSLNATPEQFKNVVDSEVVKGNSRYFTTGGERDFVHVFYDSLMSMQMALNAGEVDEIALPEAVADYFMNVTEGYEISSIVRTPPLSLALGFRKDDDPALRNKFNEALLSMKADGTLAILRAKYIDEAGLDAPEPVKFGKFENIDTTIKVAVTGDLPPIDFIATDGTPAGFNTAVLAELAKRMKVNIELVNIDSGARAAALASKRADVVFWFQYYKDADVQLDIPEGIVLSEAYYSWNEYLHIKKK